MPQVAESDVQFPGLDVMLKGFLVYPEGARSRPGVLVHPEAYGLTDQLKEVARRLAHQGYSVLAFNQYSRQPEAPIGAPYEVISQYSRRITDRVALMDLDATLAYFRSLSAVDPERVGVLGFCSAYPIVLACHDVRLRACVSFYNQVRYQEKYNADASVSPLDRIPGIWCPFQGHYGDNDVAVSVDDITLLESTLKRFGKAYDLHVYPGAPHGFFNETRPDYRQTYAETAWSRVLEFLGVHMGK